MRYKMSATLRAPSCVSSGNARASGCAAEEGAGSEAGEEASRKEMNTANSSGCDQGAPGTPESAAGAPSVAWRRSRWRAPRRADGLRAFLQAMTARLAPCDAHGQRAAA